MDLNKTLNFETVVLDDAKNTLVIIDQTLLPNDFVYLHLTTQKQIWEAIYELRVRGAPAIGIAAAYSIYLAAKQTSAKNYEEFYTQFSKAQKYLSSSRPTAVNLDWALNRMNACVLANKRRPIHEIIEFLKNEADEIKAEDIRVCKSIGEFGLSLIKPNDGILTHCNAGQLATAKYGTATAPIYLGAERGYNLKVFADETRPLLQGARLTAFELKKAGIDVTLICDNMAATVMANGWIQAVFVGCDRVAANGDTANKIGTSGVAILAQNYNIPFYICAPTATIDMNCPTGKEIHIEQRIPEEVTKKWYVKPMAPLDVKVFNPAFDVTEAKFITAIITEFGIVHKPTKDALEKIFSEKSKKQK